MHMRVVASEARGIWISLELRLMLSDRRKCGARLGKGSHPSYRVKSCLERKDKNSSTWSYQ